MLPSLQIGLLSIYQAALLAADLKQWPIVFICVELEKML